MKKINTIEEFKNVGEWYYITTCGKVVSNKGKVKVLKQVLNKYGYEMVGIRTIDGKQKMISIHRLVALAYISNIENKPQVNHINEIKTDNYVSNLEWVTAKENINHGTRNKRASEVLKGKFHTEEHKNKISKSMKGKHIGDSNPNSKPIEYYETNSTRRGHFKTACRRQGWNFDDFIEIDSGEKYGKIKKYFYILKA